MTYLRCCVPRLDCRALRGACLLLLAGFASGSSAGEVPGFFSSFEKSDPAPAATARTAVDVVVGAGPEAPYAAKASMGYSGLRALQYAASGGGGRQTLFNIDIPVQRDTSLSWLVMPEIVDGDALASTGVALDLVFDDGRRLSELSAHDQHGAGVSAAAQGASNTLYPQQWARKQVRLGELPELRGRHIRAIELEVRPLHGGHARGWLDDVSIQTQPAPSIQHRSDYVLTTRGTQSSGTFSRGNNFPATAVPHGFNFWTPVTDAGTLGWLYRWSEGNDADNRPRLQALALSHQPSPWMGDRQTFQVMPSSNAGVPEADRQRRALSFSHENELARPSLYQVNFDNGIRAEITPTERAAVFRFRYPQQGDANLLFDNVDARGGLTLDARTQTLSGFTDTRSGLSNGATRMFVYARFDRPWKDSGMLRTGRPTGYIKFDPGSEGEVQMRIATSLISVAQAQRNLEQEVGQSGFDVVHENARQAWDALLDRVTVSGASEDQLTTVYSNLYRLFLYPNIAHENVGTIAKPDWRHADQSHWTTDGPGGDAMHTSAVVRPGKVYVNNGFWDTFRTSWPAYALFSPKDAGNMVAGFLQQYQDGGWVSRWSSPGYADLMVGTSSDVAFADAWLKGVRGFDGQQAYEAALRNATVISPVSNVGRKGQAQSMYRGYVSTGTHESVSWTLENALNDFGIAQLARSLAHDASSVEQAQRYRDEADYFDARAATYSRLYDPATGFFRGRDPHGQWDMPAARFDPRVWGGDYTEANAWNFAFTAVHDGAGLATLLGGREAMASRLDTFFATPETAEARFAGSYGGIIHEMTEARDVRMGMYAHSNQPSHHIPWMYVQAGQPWKTQQRTREVMRRLYLGSEIGQGYAGDEDNGEMSAWYLFAMLGLYPLRMGADEYVIGSPAFERAEVRMDNGHILRVVARNNSADNVYVQSLLLNGRQWDRAWLRHADIAEGGTLEFTMGPEASSWGSGKDALPPSLTTAGARPVTMQDLTSSAVKVTLDDDQSVQTLFDDDGGTTQRLAANAAVTVELPAAGQVEYYTVTSGSAPIIHAGWTLEGRRAGETSWQMVDKRKGLDFAWAGQLRPFRIAQPGRYQAYRLRLESNQPLDMAELELLQLPSSAAPSDVRE